jgi:4-oxalocrotonate tautomerase
VNKRRITIPIITVLAIECRTAEQKRGLVKDITEAVVKNFKAPPERVSVAIREINKENFAVGGILFSDN